MGRQLIEHLAKDMKYEAVVHGHPVRRMRGQLSLELSSPRAFWWRLVVSRPLTAPTEEDFAEVRAGFGIPGEVAPTMTQYGEHVLEWEVR